MSIAYLDPGNLEGDLQQGAYTGFRLVWVLALAHITGFLLQSLAAKLGNVSGAHLAQICSSELPRPSAWLLYVMTEIAIIGCDIQEVLGSAIGFKILLGFPLWVGCLLTFLDTFTLMGFEYFGVQRLEGLVAVLVGTMAVCFFVNFWRAPPHIHTLATGFIPTMQSHDLRPALGTVGAIIMPHNIYLHSALVQSRPIDRSQPEAVREANKYCVLNTGVALFGSFLVNLAVVGCFAQSFYTDSCSHGASASACIDPGVSRAQHGTTGTCHIAGREAGVCSQIGLRSAGDVLEVALGHGAKVVWAVGLLAAGQSGTLTCTYAGQFVMEGFLHMRVPRWVRMLVTRSVALVPATLVAMHTDTDKYFADSVGQWLNILQAVQLPFAVVPVLLFTDSQRIMGDFRNSPVVSCVCWVAAGLVMSANCYMLLLSSSDKDLMIGPLLSYTSVIGISLLYLGALIWMISHQSAKEMLHSTSREVDGIADNRQGGADYGSTTQRPLPRNR